MSVLIAVAVVSGLFAAIASVLLVAHRLLPATTEDDLVARIDALLPQTQCAQCGHPGCRPYARAIAAGGPIDSCPPGGAATVAALAALLDRPPPNASATAVAAVVARIRAQDCIGCTLCLPSCPVDAIVGAESFRHVILAAACTGCELCVPRCPMDCIEIEPLSSLIGGSLTESSTALRAAPTA